MHLPGTYSSGRRRRRHSDGGGGGGGDTSTSAAATAAVAAAGAVTAMKTTTDTTTTAAEVKTAATGWCVAATIEPSVKTTGLVFENTVFYSSFVISLMGFILPPPLPPPYRKQTKTHPINFEYFTLLFTISIYSSSPSHLRHCRHRLCSHLDWPRDRGRKEHQKEHWNNNINIDRK